MKIEEQIEELENAPASVRERVDGLLELDRDIRDMGKDFTKESLREAKKKSKLIYKAIKRIDKEIGNMLIMTIDS